MEPTSLTASHSIGATVIKAPEAKATERQPVIERRLVIPNLTREIKKIEVFENGKLNNTLKDGVIKLKSPRPNLKVVVTYADNTTVTHERDFSASIRVLANEINLR